MVRDLVSGVREVSNCQVASTYLAEEAIIYSMLAPKYEARAAERHPRLDYGQMSIRLLRLATVADFLRKQIDRQFPTQIAGDHLLSHAVKDRVIRLSVTLDEVMCSIPPELMQGVSKDDVRRHITTLSIRTNVSYMLAKY